MLLVNDTNTCITPIRMWQLHRLLCAARLKFYIICCHYNNSPALILVSNRKPKSNKSNHSLTQSEHKMTNICATLGETGHVWHQRMIFDCATCEGPTFLCASHCVMPLLYYVEVVKIVPMERCLKSCLIYLSICCVGTAAYFRDHNVLKMASLLLSHSSERTRHVVLTHVSYTSMRKYYTIYERCFTVRANKNHLLLSKPENVMIYIMLEVDLSPRG